MRNEIGKRIRSIRLRHGWTQAQLARKLNVSTPCISYWETGVRRQDRLPLIKIAAALGVREIDLTTDTPPPAQPLAPLGTHTVGHLTYSGVVVSAEPAAHWSPWQSA